MISFFAKELLVDQHMKAVNFRLHSLLYPHMRALHLAWVSFMVAFMAWYSIPPLIDYIAEDLGISATEIYDSNMAAVSITIVCRLVIGPICERIGPRRAMAAILIVGAIPCGMTGLLQNGAGLIGLRSVIGILGATFVPCQFWATQMFSPSVVGTANAISGGWGNMGAGVTYLLMPAIYNGIKKHTTDGLAWRIVFVIPCAICILVACIDLLFATDTPHGDWFKLRDEESSGSRSPSTASANGDKKLEAGAVEHIEEESLKDVVKNQSLKDLVCGFFRVLVKPPVLIMVIHYSCSFGAELAIDNVIGNVFRSTFDLDPSTASYIGSIFGLLNICSRLSGGVFSDFLARRMHLPGRILAQLICMCLEGAFLIGFSFGITSLSTAIVIMVFFSFFVQAVCGTTFAVVPFVDPQNTGKVMGIVGAGGNLGGLIFNLMFRQFQPDFDTAFLCLGCIALGSGILGCALLRVQNQSIWQMFSPAPCHD
ncbi:major facilitator superfamily domain-containing protein [Dichotomocladium elegans]|nr:major facilitator superfamily domain-containing protein [Dichotomocladium elegans]